MEAVAILGRCAVDALGFFGGGCCHSAFFSVGGLEKSSAKIGLAETWGNQRILTESRK
jgi:hypothetical protein